MSQDLNQSDNLFSRTWKTVVVLVGASIVFVGALSATAVFVTSRAVAPSTHTPTDEAADAKADSKPATTAAKKPLSI